MAEQTAEKVQLTLAQRVAANRLLEADLKKAGLGAETWVVPSGPTPGTQVNVFDPESGVQFARITVGRAGFIQIRDYVEGTEPALMEKITEATGAKVNQFSKAQKEPYATGGGVRFDLNRLAKG